MELNTPSMLRQRETRELGSINLRHKLHVTRAMINRLGLEKELEGHTGCVNCLEWNTKGDILASASDDVQVFLWDPFKHKPLKTIRTGHNGNIFTVKFMPYSGDQIILTGAADYKVKVHDLSLNEPKMVCSCHGSRVKRLAIAPNDANLFWSAAEDGTIMQFDLRLPHQCSSESSASILVNLNNHMGVGAEAKCLAINPTRPELLAVGANDPYVRLYDRRMITTTAVPFRPASTIRLNWERMRLLASRAGEGDENENVPRKSVQYYSPGHLPSVVPKNRSFPVSPSAVSTYLIFSADGSELLVNLGGEQIYLFDVYLKRKPYSFILPQQDKSKHSCSAMHQFSEIDLQDKVMTLKERANENFRNKSYFKAINLYNEAIALNPNMAVLYANRAAAHMKRKWEGDDYAAYRDCATALALDPSYSKAHFRLINCLIALHKPELAKNCLEQFSENFPDESQSALYKNLAKDIENDADMIKKIESENKMDSDDESDPRQTENKISEMEKIWRSESNDYKLFFCGHCNTTTDIKEANFFGSNAQFIVAGSDDGSFFIWDRNTTNIIKVLKGDDSIVNCLQPHPSTCLLATSGIENVVRLWSPRPENCEAESREVKEMDVAASLNQKRMRADPFEVMLMNMANRSSNRDSPEGMPGVSCRQS